MKLGTGDVVTLDLGSSRWHFRITVNIKKQRVFWIAYNPRTELSNVISSDYHGKDKKNIPIGLKLERGFLGVFEDLIFVMKYDESRRVLIINEAGDLSRSFTMKNSDYHDLIL